MINFPNFTEIFENVKNEVNSSMQKEQLAYQVKVLLLTPILSSIVFTQLLNQSSIE